MKISIATFLLMISAILIGNSAYANPNTAVLQELYQRVETLGREIDQLRGNNEKLSYKLEQLKLRQKKSFLAMDDRMEKMRKSMVVAKPAQRPERSVPLQTPQQTRSRVPAPRAGTVKPVATKLTNAAKLKAKQAYNHAYKTLKSNRKAGINEFNTFLKNHPQSSLAENAYYWIGEAKYALHDYRGAVSSFVIVLNKYKSGRKAPDAAVKLGYSFYELKDWTLAKRTFQDVLRYFPKTNASKLAQKRLKRMKREGH